MSVRPVEEYDETAEEGGDDDNLEEFLLDKLHEGEATAALGLEEGAVSCLVILVMSAVNIGSSVHMFIAYPEYMVKNPGRSEIQPYNRQKENCVMVL